jgi:endoglucanase
MAVDGRWSAWVGALLLMVGCGDGAPNPLPPRENRLRAEGLLIVDRAGQPVVLRGVNLGSWLFHETWISQVDYQLSSRAHVLGQEQGIGTDVDDAIVEVGPGDDAAWVSAFQAALTNRIGEVAAESFIAELDMYPSLADDSDLPLRQRLEERFGAATRDELLDAFQGAWIRQQDIAWLAEQGFNVVRVPMGYRSLVTESDLAPLTQLTWNERAFARLTELLDWCEEHGLWAVIDLQESPGGHNDYSGPAQLYDDPAMQALTVELWLEIVARYGDRDIVAAWSLLAEPYSAPSPEARDQMYDQLVQAIRATGDDHLMVIHDGFKGMSTLPDPDAYGWTNVVYSTHLFEWGLSSLVQYEGLLMLYATTFGMAQEAQNVPYYIGSFSTMHDEPWAYDAAELMVGFFEEHQWSWSVWTFKRIDDPIEQALFGTETAWGVLGRLDGAFDRPDVHRDSEEDLRAKLGAYDALELRPNASLLQALQSFE